MISIVSAKISSTEGIDTKYRKNFTPENIILFGDTSYKRNTGTKMEPGLILRDAHESAVEATFELENFENLTGNNEPIFFDFSAILRVKSNREMHEKSWFIKARPPKALEPVFVKVHGTVFNERS